MPVVPLVTVVESLPVESVDRESGRLCILIRGVDRSLSDQILAGKRPMSTTALSSPRQRTAIRAGLFLLAVTGAALSGCQVDVGGQTLPSAYYLQDDIQYFPAGPEFKLSKEAAALKAYKKEIGECPDGCGGGGCSSCK